VGSCQLQNLGWGKVVLAEGADGEGIVSLGEAITLLVNEESGVKVSWGGKAQGALEQDLASGGFEEVAAADYFGDVGVCIVDDAGQLVRREAGVFRIMAKRFAPDEKIAEIFAGDEGLLAEVSVFETDNRFIEDVKTVVDVGLHACLALLRVKSRPTGARINGFVVGVFVRRVHHGGEVFATAVAGIDVSGDEESLERLAIEGEALRLVHDGWLPGDAEPFEVFEDGVGEVRLRPLRIEVLDAQQE
jgi:hypothetical protein